MKNKNRHNHLGQPVGFAVDDWQPRPWPPRSPMNGRWCRLEPLHIDQHAQPLYDAHVIQGDDKSWTYLSYGPFASFDAYTGWLKGQCLKDDPLFFTVIDLKSGKAAGVASFMRIEPQMGVIEIGHIHFSPQLQKTAAATEAIYLMSQRVFEELGYRRLEWKCDALNEPSRKAARRFGFSFEGVFRQALIYKGRNRDTAWFSIIDTEWPQLKIGYEAWLAPSNFDSAGIQKKSLVTLIEQAQ
jgi:RimJ/RimL family protein N-acetyltransferase